MSNRNSQKFANAKKLMTHDLTVEVLKNTSESMKLLTDSYSANFNGITDLKKRTQLALQKLHQDDAIQSNLFHYHHNIFHYLTNMTCAVERMDMAPILIKRFPRSKTYDDQGISLHNWIQYHYANYVITLVSIYDTSLLLTNAAFGLGIEPKKCNDKTVKKNEQVKLTPVKGSLDKISSAVQNHVDARHHFVHRNVQPQLEELDDLEGIRFVNEMILELEEDKEPIMNPHVVRLLYGHRRRSLVEDIRVQTGELTDILTELFSGLLFVYSVKIQEMSSNR